MKARRINGYAALALVATDVLVLIVLAALSPSLTFVNNAIDIWYDQRDPLVEEFAEQQATFGHESWIYINAWVDEAAEVDRVLLAAQLGEKFRALDGVTTVLSPVLLDVLQRDEEGLYYDRLPSTLSWSDLHARLSTHPIAAESLVDADDATRIGFLLNESTDFGASGADRQTLLRAIREHLATTPGLAHSTVTGSPVINAELNRLSWRDFLILIPLTMVVMFALSLAIFRRECHFAIAILAVSGLSTLSTLALMLVAGLAFNMLTIALPGVIFTLGVAAGFHVLQHYARSSAPFAGADAMIRARLLVADVRQPIMVSHVTTALGFGLLGSITVSPVQQMALWGAIGVLWSGLHVAIVLPYVLGRLGQPSLRESRLIPALADRVSGWAEGAAARPRLTFALIAGSALLFVVFALQIRVDSTYLTMVDPSERMRKDYAHLAREAIPSGQLSVVIENSGNAGLVPSGLNSAIIALENDFAALPGVRKVIGPGTIYAEVMPALLESGDTPATFGADTNAVTDAYIFALTGGSREVSRYVDENLERFRITLLFEYLTNNELRSLVTNEIEPRLARFETTLPATSTSVVGLTLLWAHMDRAILAGQLWTLSLLGLVCFAMFWVSTRRMHLAAVATLVNLMPLGAIAALMGVFGMPLDLAAVFILSLSLGIAIDDTSFFVHHFATQPAGEQDPPSGALRHTIIQTAPAMILTSVLIAAGFSVLLISSFVPMQIFGGFTALGVTLAALVDIFVLPLLVRAYP